MLPPGETLDRYEIQAVLGEGGMAVVYLAFDPRLQRRIALKLVRAEQDDVGTHARALLLREALAVAELNHPNIVAIHDVGETARGPYVAMEFVPGKTLRGFIGDSGVSAAQKIAWMRDVARALLAAHARGIIHRDVTPGNVMVSEDGIVKVLDFGVARRLAPRPAPLSGATPETSTTASAASDPETGNASLVGTPRYMAPEQLRGEVAGAASDQFAWALCTYELLSGRHPWSPLDDPTAMWGEMFLVRPAPLAAALPRDLEGVADVIARALSPLPADRFPSFKELLASLEEAGVHGEADRVGREHAARSVRPSVPASGAARRRTAAVVLALAGAGLLGGGLLLRRRLADRREAVSVAPSAVDGAVGRAARAPLVVEHARRVTFGTCDALPRYSPDGSAIVYMRLDGDHAAVGLVLVPEDGGVRDTTLIPADGWNTAPRISPDGDRITFLRSPGSGAGVYLAPVDGGGVPRRLSGTSATAPEWSADAKGVWVERNGQLVELDAADGHELAAMDLTGVGVPMHALALADGTLLALFPGTATDHLNGLALLSARSTPRWLLRGELEEVLAISPDHRRAIVSRVTPMKSLELVAVPLDGSPPEVIAPGSLPVGKGLDVSRDGRRLTWSTCQLHSQAMEVTRSGLSPIHFDAQTSLDALAAFAREPLLAVAADRLGKEEILIIDPTGERPPRSVPTGTVEPIEVAVSHDGARIALTSRDGLYVVGSEGTTAPVRLTADGEDAMPFFLSTDDEVGFTRGSAQQRHLMVVSTARGEERDLLGPGTADGVTSPAGDSLAYLDVAGESPRLMIRSLARSAERELLASKATRFLSSPRFSSDGKRLAVIDDGVLREIEVASGRLVRSQEAGNFLAYPAYTSSGLFVLEATSLGSVWVADVSGSILGRPTP